MVMVSALIKLDSGETENNFNQGWESLQHFTRISHLEPHRVGRPRAVIQREMGKGGPCRLKKMYNVSCKLFYLRTAVQEIALRNCFKEGGGKASIHVILVKGEDMHSNIYFSGRFC